MGPPAVNYFSSNLLELSNEQYEISITQLSSLKLPT